MILVLVPVLSNAVPRFERMPCAAEVATDERIECGALFVPENRAKENSRAIRLPAMIFRSRAARPAPDPLVFMTGGPGNSNTGARRSGKELPFLDERDFIVLEQRGTRLAEPALECPDINRLRGEMAAGKVRGENAMLEAAAACRQSLIAAGIDLDGYTTAESAEDLEDLRKLLGIEQWNLHGLSYGTRLMLTYLRRHPASVRSVVLDSVLPPDVNFDEVAAANLLRSLNVMFDGCASTASAAPRIRTCGRGSRSSWRGRTASRCRSTPMRRCAARRWSTRSTPRCTRRGPSRRSRGSSPTRRTATTPRCSNWSATTSAPRASPGGCGCPSGAPRRCRSRIRSASRRKSRHP